ncbi:hypothetical protein ACHAW5_002308 [Stephanodiscus triporus]|uniref:tRNA/rRNA methyltransferase SpoU type domain-containing protein n=1 Tax=Stephanodiscus triporus TaxID=2934178 RepID=A0ABD3MIF4_9STRA
MTSSRGGVQTFLAGAVCSAAIIYFYQKVSGTRTRRIESQLNPNEAKEEGGDDLGSFHGCGPPPPESNVVIAARRQSNNEGRDKKKKDDDFAALSEIRMDSCSLDQRMIRKAEGAIRNRTSRLIVVVERCTNDHNYSAILRTVEALGVQHVYIIAPQCIQSTLTTNNEDDCEVGDIKVMELKRSSGQLIKKATESEIRDRAMHHLYARKATEWLTVTDFDETKACIDSLRKDGYQIWATDLGQVATCLTEEALRAHAENENRGNIIPEKVAIVFGTEAVGCTNEMLNAADLRVYLPLRGFADSLNLSVATALVVHQMFLLDPSLIGAMGEEERKQLRQAWYAKLASQRLLSSADKKKRAKLVSFIKACEEINKKRLAGVQLFQSELDKLGKIGPKQAELDAIDVKLEADSQRAVKDLVDNPPAPITDMRRADEHRTCFVGKKTKSSHSVAWANMPATANLRVGQNTSSSFFRQRVTTEASE